MLRSFAVLTIFLAACQTPPKTPIQDKAAAGSEDKGPNVNDLVKPNQDKWLTGQVQTPGKGKITKLVVFGDSLSDAGELNKRTMGLYAPPRIFYKSRFSNGPIWSDFVSNGLGWTIDNYAVGGAETRTGGTVDRIAIPSFLQQISENKSELKKVDFVSSLIVIWIGPNNYLNNAVKAQDANQNPIADLLNRQVKDAVSDIKDGIDDLKDIGFRHFAIGTMPELGGINRNPKDPPKASDATLFAVTAAHNTALRAMLKELPKEMPEINVNLFQAYEINQKTTETPKNYGFNRLDAPCYVGNLQGRFDGVKAYCTDPSGFKFWDYLHPNSKMHCIYASQFLADMSAAGRIAGYDQNKTVARCLEL